MKPHIQRGFGGWVCGYPGEWSSFGKTPAAAYWQWVRQMRTWRACNRHLRMVV